ncbi:MAG: hypothetical protein GY795_48085 [Desulfobacterales bacterium]|nr:hypothetical protein [Desulfobacterales bacterium]
MFTLAEAEKPGQKKILCLSVLQLKESAIRLEFTLLVSVLQNRLNLIIREWKQAEEPLRLEGSTSMMFHRPPRDHEAVIPAAPMGNILAFQYVRPSDDSD